MPLDLLDLMQRYAQRGREDWKNAREWVKDRAKACLENRIADNEYLASQTINSTSKGAWDERFMFIPMPNINHDGIAQGFFLPIREAAQKGIGPVSFDLFLVVDEANCLGYRFEPPDLPNSSHGYCHVQMNRVMFRETMVVQGIQQWFPKSYPAFPIRASDSIQMFLSMATSIHGYGYEYGGGITSILQDAFKNSPVTAKSYLRELEKILNLSS